jgi:hypothetical protein
MSTECFLALLPSPLKLAEYYQYKSKQTIDTFFVRFGDMAAAIVFIVSTDVLSFCIKQLAWINVCGAVVWLLLAFIALRKHKQIVSQEACKSGRRFLTVLKSGFLVNSTMFSFLAVITSRQSAMEALLESSSYSANCYGSGHAIGFHFLVKLFRIHFS